MLVPARGVKQKLVRYVGYCQLLYGVVGLLYLVRQLIVPTLPTADTWIAVSCLGPIALAVLLSAMVCIVAFPDYELTGVGITYKPLFVWADTILWTEVQEIVEPESASGHIVVIVIPRHMGKLRPLLLPIHRILGSINGRSGVVLLIAPGPKQLDSVTVYLKEQAKKFNISWSSATGRRRS